MLRVVYSFYFFRFFLIKNLIFNFFSFSHSTFNNFFYSNTFLNYSFLLNLKSNTNAFTFNLDNLDYYKLDFSNYLSPRLLNLGYKESLKDSLYHLKSTFLIHYKSFSSIFSLFLN